MPKMIRKVFLYRRGWCVIIFLSSVAIIFVLSLQFELNAIEVTQRRSGNDFLRGQGLTVTARLKHNRYSSMSKSEDQVYQFALNGEGEIGKGHRQLRRGSGCARTKQQERSRFRELSKGILVFSVWYDNRKTQPFIRILLLMYRNNSPPSLTCSFQIASKQTILTTEAVFYEHNENHHEQYGGFVASCIVPREVETMPCSIKVSIKSTNKAQIVRKNSLTFPVGSTDRLENTVGGKYGICVPPLHGDISVDRLVEFIELTRILGASHFTFYDLAINKEMRKALSQYETKGLVSVLEWNLPEYTRNKLHYFGQVVSILDCLYRSMRDKSFIAFHDLDEFIVPLQHDNINSLLNEIHKDYHCGHCFESVVFDPSKDSESPNVLSRYRLMTQRIFYRTSQMTPYWTKCIVDPRKIFEQGIHHISKPLEEFYQAEKVDWNIARVFHYRKCQDSRALMQLKCSAKFEVDKTMRRFGEKLTINFEIASNATNWRNS